LIFLLKKRVKIDTVQQHRNNNDSEILQLIVNQLHLTANEKVFSKFLLLPWSTHW